MSYDEGGKRKYRCKQCGQYGHFAKACARHGMNVLFSVTGRSVGLCVKWSVIMHYSDRAPGLCRNGHKISERGTVIAHGREICRACRNGYSAKTYAKRKANGKLLESRLRALYGLTSEQYLRMLIAQSWKCLLCDIAIKQPYKTVPRKASSNDRIVITRDTIVVDHCHKTKVVRGLLCSMCNRGLGDFYDNPEVLIRAAEYIKRHQNSSKSQPSGRFL